MEQESGLKVNQPASFAVSLNGAKGVIDAKVHSPSGALEECCITEIDQGNHGNAIDNLQTTVTFEGDLLTFCHLFCYQISTQSASSPERMAST